MRTPRASSLIIAATAISSFASAKTLNVGGDPHNSFSTIQAAINAANPGDNIQVQKGTYNEQLVFPAGKNNITLQSGGATIGPAPTMTSGFMLTISAQNVTVKGFTFQGPLPDVAFSTGIDSGGIYVSNGSATISNNYLTQIWQATATDRGIQNGLSILVGHQVDGTTGTATINNNTFDHWQKNAITVDNTGSSATINNNVITGEGPISYTAQNGIQVGRGATGSIHNNNVSELEYAPQTVGASGILIFETSNVVVDNNQINACDFGVAFADVSNSEVGNNHIQNGLFGLDIDEFSTGSQFNEIDHNESKNNAGEGIFVSVDSINNLVDHNNFTNNAFLDAEDDSVGSGTGGTGNTWTQDHVGTDNHGGALGH